MEVDPEEKPPLRIKSFTLNNYLSNKDINVIPKTYIWSIENADVSAAFKE